MATKAKVIRNFFKKFFNLDISGMSEVSALRDVFKKKYDIDITGGSVVEILQNAIEAVDVLPGGGDCGCRIYGINERLPAIGEEGVYYIRQYSKSVGGVIYDTGWTVQKWEDGRYVDRTHGYRSDIVTGTGTGNAVWDINEVGYNFSDIINRISSHSASARIKVQLGEQELYTYPYDNGNTLVCNALFLPGNSVNGFTFNIIDGGGGVPKISEPYQVLNGVVTDLTPYIAAITTEVAFYIYERKNFGPIS